jgi:hypothetical protein
MTRRGAIDTSYRFAVNLDREKLGRTRLAFLALCTASFLRAVRNAVSALRSPVLGPLFVPRGAGHEVIDPRGALFGEWVPSEWLWGPYTRLENPAIRTPRRCSTWNIRRNEE